MRALWLVRPDLTLQPGGDTTQILQTAEALRRRGVEIALSDAPDADVRDCDVVHLFHLDRTWENLPHCRRIRSAGTPAVLSTIWWPMGEFDLAGREGFQGWLARRLGSERYQGLRAAQRGWLRAARLRRWPNGAGVWRGYRAALRSVLESVRVILPNSRAEQVEIEKAFGVARPAVVVPNAADAQVFRSASRDAAPRAGALCVGRIEPRKNQLALIEALRGTGVPLTLVGQAGRYSRAYERRCRAAGAEFDVQFLGHEPAAVLAGRYQGAAVHVCPSWYETPGLASLEAALCGCALVVTDGGCTREYFGDEALYAAPDDAGSLRAAVLAALARGASAGLRERIARECSWDAAAEATLAGYRLALGGNAECSITNAEC